MFRSGLHTRWRCSVARVWAAVLVAWVAGAAPLQADIFTPSDKDQAKLGDQAAAQVVRKYRVLHDERALRVERVGQRLLDALTPKERGPWEYRFYVIESKDVNAFALPGGKIFLFTGLYDRMKSEDELAAVMAHEITHVRKEHWARQYGQQMKRQAGLAVILGLAKAGKTAETVAGLADGLLTLRYSRKDEDQSDSEGLKDMVAAGYNPQGMLDLFRTLKEASGGGGGGPAFLADHPLTRQRIERTQERIDKLGPHGFRPLVPLEGKP